MSRNLSEVPILPKNVQDARTELFPISGSIAIYTFRNITSQTH